MSSIRPLATITILVCVGVFLYLKINETEPVIPEGVGTFEIEAGLELDDPGADAFATGSTAGSFAMNDGAGPPAFSATTPAGPPPAFNPGAASEAPPAWTPPADASASVGSNELPAMPAVPSVESDATEMADSPMTGGEQAEPVMTVTPSIIIQEEEKPLGIDPEVPLVEPAPSNNVVSTEPAPSTTPTPQTSLFGATRTAVQAALDRGELSQALLLLSDWYGDPSLTPEETAEVNQLLSQLAGTVIYSSEPRLEAPYLVQAGETLQQIAAKYDVPWQLLAKINGLASPAALQTGQELKVIPGPFNAKIDISSRELTLMLGRRYAGRFAIEVDPSLTVEDGNWLVDQKPITPTGGLYSASPGESGESRSIVLSNPSAVGGQVAVLRAATGTSQVAGEPVSRTIK
ncbi:MAG: LysM peptidoglycan-binding domain-containing protein, partial [Lacipirellulaceae bacterium]